MALPENVQKRLKHINAELAKYNLRPLVHLGNVKNNEFELLEISAVWPNRWFVMVQFECIRPDGQSGHYNIKFSLDGNQRSGCIVVPHIKDTDTGKSWLIFVRQHRPAMLTQERGHWTSELPRIWATYQGTPPLLVPPFSPDGNNHTRPERVVECELSPVLKEPLISLMPPVLLSRGDPEDTGMSVDLVDTWLLPGTATQFPVIRKRLETNSALSIRFYDLEEVRKKRKDLGFRDQHTKSALLELYEYLDANPQK